MITRRALLASGLLVPLAGCGTEPAWRPVRVTGEPATLAAAGDRMLLGTFTDRPALTGPAGPIAVTATSGYGREGRWVTLGASSERIVGVCAVRGGAHGNQRWTVFRGDSHGVAEQEQPFEVFHGYGAGTLVGALFNGTQPVLVGSWGGAAAGYDVALWVPTDGRWTRLNSAGTALAATSTSLPNVAAATGGEGLLLAGRVIQLSPARTRPVVWTSADARTGWRRIDLPTEAPLAAAESIARSADGWLVTGRAGDTLVAWLIGADLVPRPLPLPDVPGSVATRAAAGPDGLWLIAAGDGRTTTVLAGRPDAWQRSTVPAGVPRAAAFDGPVPHLIAATGSGTAQLFALS